MISRREEVLLYTRVLDKNGQRYILMQTDEMRVVGKRNEYLFIYVMRSICVLNVKWQQPIGMDCVNDSHSGLVGHVPTSHIPKK